MRRIVAAAGVAAAMVIAGAAVVAFRNERREEDPRTARGVAEALKEHLEQAPEESEITFHGPISRVDCRRSGARFRGREIFNCEVTHTGQVIAIWCAAVVDGPVYTQGELGRFTCSP